MSTTTTNTELERAASDYLSISRRAGLFGPVEYERAEARAWARLQAALAERASQATPAAEPEKDAAECAGWS